MHGLVLTPLSKPTSMAVEEFRIDSSTTTTSAFQNHHERTLTGAWAPAQGDLPAGTFRLDMAQPLAARPLPDRAALG
jgi:hypothetical protein